MGRSASPVLESRSPNTEDAERPGCIPTQSAGTRGFRVNRSKYFVIPHVGRTLWFDADKCPTFGNAPIHSHADREKLFFELS